MSRHHRHFSIRALLAPTVILLLALGGCASNASGHPRGTQATSTVSTGHSSATATSTTAAASSSQPSAVCTSNGGSPLTVQKLQVGRYGSASFNVWEQLPDSLALKPQMTAQVTPVATGAIGKTVDLDVTFNLPPTAQPAYVCGVTARVVSFTSLAGPATNVYLPCVDQAYLDPGGFHPSSACPAGPLPAGLGNVTFASSAVGAEASSSITFQPPAGPSGTPQPGEGQPAQIPQPTSEIGGPGSCCAPNDVLIGVHVAQPGTYTFAVSLWQDSSGPSVTGPNVTAMFLFGQAQHEWGGQPCTQPAMQSQLPPATNPPTQVICPGGAPAVQ